MGSHSSHRVKPAPAVIGASIPLGLHTGPWAGTAPVPPPQSTPPDSVWIPGALTTDRVGCRVCKWLHHADCTRCTDSQSAPHSWLTAPRPPAGCRKTGLLSPARVDEHRGLLHPAEEILVAHSLGVRSQSACHDDKVRLLGQLCERDWEEKHGSQLCSWASPGCLCSPSNT